MAVSMRDLDSAFQGAGQKAYPLSCHFFHRHCLDTSNDLISQLN